MKRWFLENFWLKILAFVIALSLWAYIGTQQVTERKMTLNIEFADIPAGVVLSSNVRTRLPVIVRGRKEAILDLDSDELKAVVSLKGYVPGQREMTVHPKVQTLPNGVIAFVADFQVPVEQPSELKKSSKKKSKK